MSTGLVDVHPTPDAGSPNGMRSATTTTGTLQVRRESRAVLGIFAVAAMVTLGVLSAQNDPLTADRGPRVEAGSGSAPKNTVYNQPVVKDMNLGATATWTPPAALPATTRAVPAAPGH